MARLYSYYILMLFSVSAYSQDKPAYRIFTIDGKPTQYEQMLKSSGKRDAIFIGELHDNALVHWLELQMLQDVYNLQPALTLGMEMFEADDQIILDEYLSGLIEERHLLYEAKIWDNYKTDYRPLVEFAKAKKLKVIATNIPRRYANLVYRRGLKSLDTLSQQSKSYMAPLPITVDLQLPGYKNLLNGNSMQHSTGSPENMAVSQATKDATMAYFISLNKDRKNTILHINGAYHSQNKEGILWYLKKWKPELTVITIQFVEQTQVENLDKENIGKADFIICIPDDMTKTY